MALIKRYVRAEQAHPSPQTLAPVLTQMSWTQLNKAIMAAFFNALTE